MTRAGVVTLDAADGGKRMVVGPGFAEVGPTEVTLLVDSCEDAEAVDKDAALRDLSEAEAALAANEPNSEAWKTARRAADLAQARLEA